ncbi:MAG: hypothetical protein KJ558_05130 [Gammaproteobacteria bacterium]|nr:hypothetical protein [Gammaproteobacteria bacterium]MBU1654199.1 hypothetical protein [Gammaproteobacteria bacterium]MBU1960859.1 hypothetical protein [Gammaproteobacteria bacterium]
MAGSIGFRMTGLALLLGASAVGLAVAAGGDCTKIDAPTERMICEDPQLNLLDGMIAKIYQDLKERLPAEDAETLAGEQLQWIERRDGFLCPDVYSCISTYNERLIELRRRQDAMTSLKPEQRALLKRLRALLTRMEEQWELEPVPGLTGLPNLGLRGLFLRSGMTPGKFRDWFGQGPFLSGPHGPDRYDFHNKKDFGRYDPRFLAAFKERLGFLIDNPLTRPLMLGFYDNQMMDIAPAYFRMHSYLHAPENAGWVAEVSAQYRQALEQDKGLFRDGYHYPYREFQAVAKAIGDKEGLNVHELTTAGPFWLRRQMDGTEGPVFELLALVMKRLEAPAPQAPATP